MADPWQPLSPWKSDSAPSRSQPWAPQPATVAPGMARRRRRPRSAGVPDQPQTVGARWPEPTADPFVRMVRALAGRG